MLFFYCLLGLVTGVLSAIIGIGGGIFIVPSLVYFAHMSQHRAQGTSIGALLAPIGIFAFFEYYRANNVDVRAAIAIALTFAVGGYFGGKYAQGISEVVLRRIFAVVLVAVAIRLIMQK